MTVITLLVYLLVFADSCFCRQKEVNPNYLVKMVGIFYSCYGKSVKFDVMCFSEI
ncbi:hypothetical protein MANES_18G025320v8 [Manihot esculenta]|uniref:Uncharacterized protein n=1 Tax=Manihot esculenta TaxID=3983 RepID=A0ACC8C654_MANES|nr:hypothetical protein MANES_18G025320v8 [Manihot esculenta]